MRARAVILASAASAGIILLGWQAGTGQGASLAVSPNISAGSDGGSSDGGGSGSGSGSLDGSGSAGIGSSGNGSSGSSGSGSSGTGTGSSGTGTGSPGSGSSGSGSSGTGAAPNAAISGTYKGSSVSTRFGSVQVQVTIAKGVITEITPLQLTDRDQRSVFISSRAAPVLRSEVLAAQSANVQTIGGATYTCEGYLSSLQAALDSAHFQTQSGG